MAIAFMNIFNVNVVHNIWEHIPLEDISIKVLHQTHACQLEPDEYCFEVPIGTTVRELKERLLDVEFRKFEWLPDEMVIQERCNQHVIRMDSDDFEEGTTLCLNLVFNWPQSDSDDDND